MEGCLLEPGEDKKNNFFYDPEQKKTVFVYPIIFVERYTIVYISAAKVDLDHLLLDGGWKRGEFEWLKFVCFQC